MAVTRIHQNPIALPHSGELDERGQRRYFNSWLVQTDDSKDGPQVVGDAVGLPRLYDVYVFGNDVDNGARVKRISPRRMVDEPRWWEVEFEYDSVLQVAADGNRNPMLRPPKVRWATVPYQKVAEYDVNGNAIGTMAREETDPPHMRDADRLSLTITRNELNFQVALAFSYTGDGGVVANDSFFGFAPFESKMMSVESDLMQDGEYSFWQTTYQIHFLPLIADGPTTPFFIDPDGNFLTMLKPWNLNYPNVGFYCFSGAGSVYGKCVDDREDKESKVPFKLDQAGFQIPFNTPRNQQYLISAQVHKELPFAPLLLP